MVGTTTVSDVHTPNTQFLSLAGAYTVPCVGTAEVVLGTDQILTGESVATDAAVVCTAATFAGPTVTFARNAVLNPITLVVPAGRTYGAILRTCHAGFVVVALAVSTAEPAVELLDIACADIIPGNVATEGVGCADALLQGLVIAASRTVVCAAVPCAGTTIIGLGGAK